MKYRVDVVYRTEVMKKMQPYLDMMMTGKLSAQQSFEFDTKEPLTDEVLTKIVACRPDWADGIRVYPVTSPAVEIY